MTSVMDSCVSIFMFSWFYNSRIGTDLTCCDTCCRCTCCDDKGELPEEEQQGRKQRTAQGNTSAEDAQAPPRYEESAGMKVPNVSNGQGAVASDEQAQPQTGTAVPAGAGTQ